MIYDNLNDPRTYLEVLSAIDKAKAEGKSIEIRVKSQQRTLRQNAYYRLILRYYASQIGITETDAEREFKVDCEANKEKFVTEVEDKRGNIHKFIRSSADLTKDEMSSCIRNFIDYAAIYAGVILPYESDYGHIQEAKREIENNKYYI